MRRFPIAGSVALVTGAAGGIGRGVGLALARRGAALALLDRDAAGLEQCASMMRAEGAKVSEHIVDLRDAAALEAAPQAVAEAHGRLDILVNNAGVALAGRFEQLSMQDVDAVLDVNLRAPIRLTIACLPLLRAAREARVVNIASIFGVIAPAGQTAYAASKFGLRGFSEALGRELQQSAVGVTTILPGGVATGIADRAPRGARVSDEDAEAIREEARWTLTMPPERAGEMIVEALSRRRTQALIGRDARLVALLARLAPTRHMAIIERLAAWSKPKGRG